MKSLAVTASLAALGVMLALPAGAQAQQQYQGGTRIAVVNMYVVMKGYKKVDLYKDQIEEAMKPYKEHIDKVGNYYKQWEKIATSSAEKDEKDKALKQMKICKRDIEDKTAEANKKFAELSQQNLVQIYREIEDVIGGYAKSNGYSLVLHYAEPTEVNERYSPRNLSRKLVACPDVGACGAIYVGPNMDISEDVLNVLNSRYPGAASAAPAAGTPSAN